MTKITEKSNSRAKLYLYSELPRRPKSVHWDLYWWAKEHFYDYAADEAACPYEHWRYYKPTNVADAIAEVLMIDTCFGRERIRTVPDGVFRMEFRPYKSFHSEIETYEIFTVRGLWMPLDQDVRFDGFGYAGYSFIVPCPSDQPGLRDPDSDLY